MLGGRKLPWPVEEQLARAVGKQMVDEVRITTVPRYKTSNASGDEWRFSASLELFYKGHLLYRAGFNNVMSAATSLPTVIQTDTNKWDHPDVSDLCQQEGCAEKATYTYRIKKVYCKEGCGKVVPPCEFFPTSFIRKFCNYHNNRGDCALEDADDNYELIVYADSDTMTNPETDFKKEEEEKTGFKKEEEEKTQPADVWMARAVDQQCVDEVRITTVTRKKESELSGDEWRFSASVEMFYKGHLLHNRFFSNVEEAAIHLPIIIRSDTYDVTPNVSDLCQQEGCKKESTHTYRIKKKVCVDGCGCETYPYELMGKPFVRKFCTNHKKRGNCALEDADKNYELLNPGTD
jgi:hypothetical protein